MMGQITVETCEIEGLKIITPQVHGDARGYFMETYQYNDFKEAGIPQIFVQDNQSASKRGVIRGLHFQKQFPQDKLVRVIRGEVFDVAVDLREGSKTLESGSGSSSPRKIRNNSSFPRTLPTVFWYSPITRSSAISAAISITRGTRADWPTMTRTSGSTGLSRRIWS